MSTLEDSETRHSTPIGVHITGRRQSLGTARDGARAIEGLASALDMKLGCVLTSGFEFPGRYTRWDVGFVDPSLVLEARDARVELRATNARGLLLVPVLARVIAASRDIATHTLYCDRVVAHVRTREASMPEEERLRAPSVLSVLRALVDALRVEGDEPVGFYGAFGYDLVFGIEELQKRLPREEDARDLVLFFADDIVVVDHARDEASRHTYELSFGALTTRGLARESLEAPSQERVAPPTRPPAEPDAERFRDGVRKAREAFFAGDLFEVVLSHTFERDTLEPGSVLFARLRERNPAPYGFYVSLGREERLIGASPEMFVRVTNRRVETCPIAGTVARHGDPLIDAERIRALLADEKEAAELTMCTDVDRNDKARVCEPGSVRVIGRRQIEVYSKLIHTVDHVEGTLRDDADGIDAMLAHAWAVTVTGAPKLDAMQFIEDHEDEPRRYYGGAVGFIGLDGRVNTGLTLRTIHLVGTRARVRAGATLLHASDPIAEELETRTKARALLEVLEGPRAPLGTASVVAQATRPTEPQRTVLLVDHRDSFVHTLGDYLRQAGVRVVTYRSGFDASVLDRESPSLAVLSPGPGSPRDLGLSRTIAMLLARDIPIFGVCLGLQGIVEHFGGSLDRLAVPAHGARADVSASTGVLFRGLPPRFSAGRYHSLHANAAAMPACLAVTASTDDGVVMAVEHRSLPIYAVQFHPESILTPREIGTGILANVLAHTAGDHFARRSASSNGSATSS